MANTKADQLWDLIDRIINTKAVRLAHPALVDEIMDVLSERAAALEKRADASRAVLATMHERRKGSLLMTESAIKNRERVARHRAKKALEEEK